MAPFAKKGSRPLVLAVGPRCLSWQQNLKSEKTSFAR